MCNGVIQAVQAVAAVVSIGSTLFGSKGGGSQVPSASVAVDNSEAEAAQKAEAERVKRAKMKGTRSTINEDTGFTGVSDKTGISGSLFDTGNSNNQL